MPASPVGVDEDAQHPAAGLVLPLEVDELVAQPLDDGLDELVELCRVDRFHVSVHGTKKKVGRKAHF